MIIYNMSEELTPLPVLEPDVIEKNQIKELQRLYPNLDYLMCLCLVKSSRQELEELAKNEPPKLTQDTFTIIENGFSVE